MDREQTQREIRNALNISDELSRHERADHSEALSHLLAALRTTLDHLDREIGGSGVSGGSVQDLARIASHIERDVEQVSGELRSRFRTLLASGRRIEAALRRPFDPPPSKPLFGVLPLARFVPQDVHSVMDYATSFGIGFTALSAKDTSAKVAALALATSGVLVSALTDYRLSLAKLISIETHEAVDHAWGLAAIAAPFVFGYAKRSPLTAAVHVNLGLSRIAASLVTDYRASRGLVRPMRSRGGPEAHKA